MNILADRLGPNNSFKLPPLRGVLTQALGREKRITTEGDAACQI